MDTYGLKPTGSFFIEKVKTRESWSSLNIGRIILDLQTGNAYLGSVDGVHGDNGWIPIGLSDNIIKNSNIDWDFDMIGTTDKISSINIPCNYNGIITDIQSAITDLSCNVNNLIYNPSGYISPGSINSLHFDTTSSIGVTAKTIPIIDCYDRFISSNVEDALLERLTSSELIIMPPDSTFGELLKFDVNNVENALVNLEQYLYTLQAETVYVNYDSTTITVQTAFENISDYFIPCFSNFTNNCCQDDQIIVSKDGKFICSDLNSNLKILNCSSKTEDIQTAYNELCSQLKTLVSFNSELNRILDIILKEIGTIYCILERCMTCDIWEIDC